MSYPGRSHGQMSTSGLIYQLLRLVEKGLSWEVSRGHSTNRNVRKDWTIYSVSNTKINYNTKSECK